MWNQKNATADLILNATKLSGIQILGLKSCNSVGSRLLCHKMYAWCSTMTANSTNKLMERVAVPCLRNRPRTQKLSIVWPYSLPTIGQYCFRYKQAKIYAPGSTDSWDREQFAFDSDFPSYIANLQRRERLLSYEGHGDTHSVFFFFPWSLSHLA